MMMMMMKGAPRALSLVHLTVSAAIKGPYFQQIIERPCGSVFGRYRLICYARLKYALVKRTPRKVARYTTVDGADGGREAQKVFKLAFAFTFLF